MKNAKSSGLNLTATEIARVTKGVLTGVTDCTIHSISTDTRSIKEGDIFLALEGENFNGHEYVAQAIKKGALGAIVKKGFKMTVNDKQMNLFLEVDDTLDAYQDIAAHNRDRHNAKVVAITGSTGKTTTKEMVRSILSTLADSAVISEKNFNNHVGVPMTLLKIRENHKVAVLEIGINQINEMDRLAQITNPDIALVTNAGSSHLEFLKNVDTVAHEKMKLADGLKEGGTLIYNYDDLRLLSHARSKKARTMTFGFSKKADISGVLFEDIRLNQSKLLVRLSADEEVAMNLKINGKHNAYNALAAITIARALKIQTDDIFKGLESFEPKDMRSENIALNREMVLTNDAYNANPDSMKAALTLHAGFKGGGRKVVVLGDMHELGSYSERAHKEIGADLTNFNIDLMFFYGEEMKHAAKNAGLLGVDKKRIHWHSDLDTLFDDLVSRLEYGDWILIKGSRPNRLEVIAEKLIDTIGVTDKLISR